MIGKYCSLRTAYLPENVTTIGSRAFADCDLLTGVVIPQSAVDVTIGAFSSCSFIQLFCEAASKPDSWQGVWESSSNLKIYWADDWEWVGGKIDIK